MKYAWHTYSLLGVDADDNGPISRRIILSNRVAAVVFVLGIGVTAYFLSGDYSSLTLYWFAFLLGTVWVMPFLNAMGHSGLSRHILSSFMPLFVVGITAHTRVATPDEVHGASFYIPRFYLMAISFFPLLLFSPLEKGRMYVSLGVNVLILLFFNNLLNLFGAGMGVLEPAVNHAFFISISSVISLGIIGFGFFFLNQLNVAYEQRIEVLLQGSEEKNLRIQSAINYAKNIQQVVLPNKELEAQLGNRFFCFYQPLEMVSGDFYLLRNDADKLLFAVIDCTGHGVPGAFVSLLAHSALQRALSLRGLQSPSDIIEEANQFFHEDLSKSGNPDVRDGMDIALCLLDTATMELRVSGANLTAYIIQHETVIEHRCDRGAICAGNPNRKFNETAIKLSAGDMVYLTTDGFPDQFGGAQDKRFGRRTLAKMFAEMSSRSIPEQRNTIASTFQNWKGEHPQVDDVCVMGVRV